MEVIVFGPNLQDQSKGDFVVHAASCKDCNKLRKRNEVEWAQTAETMTDIVTAVYSDFFAEHEEGSPGSTADGYFQEFHFCPCVKRLPR